MRRNSKNQEGRKRGAGKGKWKSQWSKFKTPRRPLGNWRLSSSLGPSTSVHSRGANSPWRSKPTGQGSNNSNRRAADFRPLTPSPPAQNPNPVDNKELIPAEPSQQSLTRPDITKCTSLNYKVYLGNETRTLEFKMGGGHYMKYNFPDDVLRYGCAFLNTEGGSLVIGVADDGRAYGVQFDHHREDQTRLLLDKVVKDFVPPLFPQKYSLRFVPVVNAGPRRRDLKVLCLTFRPPSDNTLPILYYVRHGEVYLKRDASVQGPLDYDIVSEWLKQNSNKALAGNKASDLQVEKLKQIASEADQSIQESDMKREEEPDSSEGPSSQTSRGKTRSQYRSRSPRQDSDHS